MHDYGSPHETLLWRQGGKAGLRHDNWKLVQMGSKRTAGKAQWELYDLARDMSEEANLAVAQLDPLAKLIKIWEKLNGEMSDPLF